MESPSCTFHETYVDDVVLFLQFSFASMIIIKIRSNVKRMSLRIHVISFGHNTKYSNILHYHAALNIFSHGLTEFTAGPDLSENSNPRSHHH